MTSTLPKKILIVDDDLDILDFLRIILKDEGYTAQISKSGENIESIIQNSLPDLILLDVLLSGVDGKEIARNLKNGQETKDIPLIMFSAHTNVEDMAKEVGVDDFIAKPFEIDDLLAKIAHYV